MTRTENDAKTTIRTAEQRATSSRVLGRISLLPIAAAAVMGWSASFIGLHGFAYRQMTGFTTDTAWLVPGAIDLSALGCTILVYRASINGRSGFASRVLMYLFTALSAWVNWIHQVGGPARFVACVLPVSAVVVFDRLAGEIRADWEADHGRKAFRMRLPLLMLRWLVDRAGTREAFRDQIRSIPVSALAGLGADLAEAAKREPTEGPARPAEGPARPAEGPARPAEGPADVIPDFIPDTIMSLPTRPGAPGPAPEPATIPGPRPGPAADLAAPAAIITDANGNRPGPAGPGLPSSEAMIGAPDAMIGAPDAKVIDVVRAVYRDDWDTATITKVVMDNMPGANPETVKRSIGKTRARARGRAQSGAPAGPSGPNQGPAIGQYL